MRRIATDQPQLQSEAAARNDNVTVFVALETQRVAVARRGEHPRLAEDLKALDRSVER